MEIRPAHPNEVSQIMTLIESARQEMASYGSDQWQDGYPDENVIIRDILDNVGFVALIENEIVAYAAVIQGTEPEYSQIYDGKWQHDNYLYTTIHRLAVSAEYRGQKVAQTFLQGLIEWHKGPDFRCDTHEKNLAMQHILEKLGFVYCGKVPVSGVRLAYQKIKTKKETSLYQEVAE